MKMLTLTNAFPNYWYRLRYGLKACLYRLRALLPFAIVNRDFIADLKHENDYLAKRAQEANDRWVNLNALMAHRAQQERGLICVKQKGQRLTVLATKTSPGGNWEVTVA